MKTSSNTLKLEQAVSKIYFECENKKEIKVKDILDVLQNEKHSLFSEVPGCKVNYNSVMKALLSVSGSGSMRLLRMGRGSLFNERSFGIPKTY